MNNFSSYQELIRPTWAPPAWIFGPVWSVLYILIVISFGKVFLMLWQKQITWIVALPFALNLIFNLSFTWIQFGLKNNVFAAVDILLVLATLIWAMFSIWPKARWIALINIPYLLWVSFAVVLQLTITFLNK